MSNYLPENYKPIIRARLSGPGTYRQGSVFKAVHSTRFPSEVHEATVSEEVQPLADKMNTTNVSQDSAPDYLSSA